MALETLSSTGELNHSSRSPGKSYMEEATVTKIEQREPVNTDSDDESADDGDFNDFMSFIKAPSPKNSPVESPPAPKVHKVALNVQVVPLDGDSDDSDEDFSDFMSVLKNDKPKTVDTVAAAIVAPKKTVVAAPAKPKATPKAVPVKAVPAKTKAPVAKAAPAAAPVKKAAPTYVKALSEEAAPTKAASAGLAFIEKALSARSTATTVSSSASAESSDKKVAFNSAPTYVKPVEKAAPAPDKKVVFKTAEPTPTPAPIKKADNQSSVRAMATAIDSKVVVADTTTATKPKKPELTKGMSKADIAASDAVSKVTLHPETPIAIRIFTTKAAEDAARNKVEMRELALENMGEGHRYFDKLGHEAEVKRCADIEELIHAQRPAAVEYFTAKDLAIKQKKQAEIQALHDNPPPMSEGQAYFTNKMKAELERQRDEIQALIDNPPPASVAGEHFKIKEQERQVEIEAMRNEPAPMAIEYFTQKAREEEAKAKEAMEKSSANTGEPAVATKHFVEVEKQKALEIEAARATTSAKEPMEALPADYFTKLADAQLAAKEVERRRIAEAEMPIGIRYFTEKAAADKIVALEEQRKLSGENMSEATRHFKIVEEEKMAKSLNAAEADMMPAAIQKFTLEARAVQDKKQAEIRAMHDNPPAMSEGQAYFTNKMRAELERQRSEIQALIDNPPPASVAGEHFKIKEAKRQAEIEAMRNEPAPVAIEYFTQKANDEKARNKAALENSSSSTGEASVATKHFVEAKKQKAADIEAARAETQKKAPMEPVPADYFTKLNDRETAAKARANKSLAESQMPSAINFFTKQAEQERAEAQEAGAQVHEDMSVATQYFHKAAAEEKIKAKAEEEGEMMPAAIQKFTMAAREESMRKKAILEEMKMNPPPPAVGIVHFTPELQQQ